MKNNRERYKKKCTQKTHFFYEHQLASHNYTPDIAIIIPAYNEFPTFFETVASLEKAAALVQKKILLIIVINNTRECKAAVKENNAALLLALKNYQSIIPIEVIDCTSNTKELPPKNGVGLARKIGMDFAIEINTPLLACMDADTLVDENYFLAIFDTFSQEITSLPSFGTTDFTHQIAQNATEQQAITMYENYLKTHSKKFQTIGYPYFPVALGPTIVCTQRAYIEAGGMNTRNAGEDFYFLQKLIKNNILSKKNLFFSIKTCVHPSSRISQRVPFGTGQVIADYNKNQSEKKITNQHYKLLEDLISFFQLAAKLSYKNEDKISFEKEFSNLHLALQEFLSKENFLEVRKNLVKNNASCKNLYNAFLIWFDGLKAIQFFHFLDSTNAHFFAQ
ncbi:MAG: glycosyltransferase [Treponemataceae bacterium]